MAQIGNLKQEISVKSLKVSRYVFHFLHADLGCKRKRIKINVHCLYIMYVKLWTLV